MKICIQEARTDFPGIITALQQKGMTLHSIGNAVQRGHSTIQMWQAGQRPQYDAGNAVLELAVLKGIDVAKFTHTCTKER